MACATYQMAQPFKDGYVETVDTVSASKNHYKKTKTGR
jgi:hypothetical protein